jgi:hypothetical protein
MAEPLLMGIVKDRGANVKAAGEELMGDKGDSVNLLLAVKLAVAIFLERAF